MGRNLVICFDGTSNQFGPQNTNVVRLTQVLDRDPQKQRLYYDPGVGTLPEPGVFTAAGKAISELFGLAFGAGLVGKVEEAYSYLMDFWEPGDQVFVFGFSRGAYTARVLAGMLHSLGLLPRGNQNLLPYAFRLYKAVRDSKDYWNLVDEFRWTFSKPVAAGDDERRFRVHFLGLWDTVSSVGWVWDPATFPFTLHNPSVDVVRHAVSLDERRWFFRQNRMQAAGSQDLKELWFPGVHCDVGGGYPEAGSGLWRVAFEWILGEAATHGLLVDQARLQKVLNKTSPSPKPWLDPKEESLKWYWWPAEFFPKLQWTAGGGRVPRVGLGRHRTILANELLALPTLLRIRESKYDPPNLTSAFRAKVRELPNITTEMPYTP